MVANIIVDSSIGYQRKVTMVDMASIGKQREELIEKSMSQMEICSYTTNNSECSDIMEAKAAKEAIIYLAMESFFL